MNPEEKKIFIEWLVGTPNEELVVVARHMHLFRSINKFALDRGFASGYRKGVEESQDALPRFPPKEEEL